MIEAIKNLSEKELKDIGLKSGLEIHQQLEGHKLFCSCPTDIRTDKCDFEIKRKLRAIAGEEGLVDAAALAEGKKDKYFIYEGYDDTTCLVEIDEMPPQVPNMDAINSAVMIAKIFDMDILNQIRFMRKTVVDGSNTSGFQRTALVAMNGKLKKNSNIEIESVLIEEDSCNIIEKSSKYKKYNLSRLGIPLIEIATGPNLKTPIEIKETSEYIGMVLRSLPNVKRGLGTIRQDVNISIKEGVRVEIKGAQDLKLIPTIAEYEAIRQKNMLNLFKELKKRKAKVSEEIIDLSETLKDSKSKVITSGLSKKDGVIVGIKLEGFSGLTGFEIQPGRRYGSELSDHAKGMGVKGLFHSDELPNYGITEEEKNKISKKLKCKSDDAFIIIADENKIANNAIKAVIERAKNFSLIKCVRNARPNGTSSYMRPMPGASRMYPETDIRPVSLDVDSVKIPKLLNKKINDLEKDFKLSFDICKKLIRNNIDMYALIKEYPKLKPSYIVDYYFSLPSLIKKKHSIEIDATKFVHQIFEKLNDNKISKDSVVEILIHLEKNKPFNYDDYLPLSLDSIKEEVKKLVKENSKLPKGAIIGKVMGKYASKVDGKELIDFINSLI